MASSPQPLPDASPELAQANFRHMVSDIAWFGLGLPATMSFLSVYAIRIDASATVLGLLAALPAIFALMTSTLARPWRNRYTDSARAIWWPGFGFRLIFVLCALTPFFPSSFQPYWLVLAVTLPALPQGISNVLFLILMRESVENRRITALTSRRSMIFNLSVAAGTLAYGLWLDTVRFPLNYQLMFVSAFILALVSMYHVQSAVPIYSSPMRATNTLEINPWRDSSFLRVVFLVMITYIPMFMIVPIITMRLVEDLGASEGFMAYFALASQIAAAITAAMTDRIVRTLGSRTAMALGMVGMSLAAAMIALFTSLPPMLIAGALGGATWTLTAIAIFGYFNENMPQEHVARFSTGWNQITMLCVFIGPMVGSQLVNLGMSVVAVLLVGAALRLLGGIMIPAEILVESRRGAARQPATAGSTSDSL